MFSQDMIFLAVIILFLLTVVLFGMISTVFRMSFGAAEPAALKVKLSLPDYLPQALLLAAALVLGVFIPSPLRELIHSAACVAGK